jgi:nicotinate-nucleotide adenylyltransferase
MRVGIFGGTFDPVHLGHLILAEQAKEQAHLDEVWFVPAPRPPQKEAQAITRFDQRVEMLALALAGNPAFRIDELEKERAGLSYTVDTLFQLHARHPEHDLFLLVGGDSLADLHKWHEPTRILQLAGLVVMARPGVVLPSPEELCQRLKLPSDAPLSLLLVEAPVIDVSSHDLRSRVAEGRSIRYFVPSAVEVYIHEKRLYTHRREP